jgi:hypothetical protein
MRKFTLLTALFAITFGRGQDLNDIFVSGIEDAERFAIDYLSPVSEGAIFGISNGWYNSADSKPLAGFEISIVGNITGFKNKEDKKAFLLDPNDYENLDFVENPGQARMVSTGLGDLEGMEVFVEEGVFRREFVLPSGLAAENLNFIPSGFIQASVGLIKGLEVKARFLPKLKFEDDVKLGLFGAGLQYDFTKLLPADKLLPIAISAVIGYTGLDGEYDFTDSSTISGSDQRMDASFKTWNFSAVLSTRNIPVINFYGGLGYITGKSDIDLLGTYQANGPFFSETVVDPFSVSKKANGVTANLGTKLKLGFFRLNAEYNFSEFNTFTFGVNFGFR